MAANKKVSIWKEEIKFQFGTINSCIAQFRIYVQESETLQSMFPEFANAEISNKTLNAKYYDRIKTAYNIGSTVTRQRTGANGCVTEYSYIRKCSVWDIYSYLYKQL
jgi:hypothetical protein